MLLELEKRRGPRALLLRRPPRHASTRDGAEPSSHLRAYFCQSLTESFLTAGPRSETSDRGLSRTRTWVEPTSLHAAAPISMRCLLTLAATNRSHLLTRTPTVVPLLLLPPVTPSRPPRTRSTGEQVSETTPFWFLYGVRGE